MDSALMSPARGEWMLLAENVDPARFDRGRIGPYRLGTPVRGTALGEVVLALADQAELVLELDLYDALVGSPAAGVDGLLMLDLAQAAHIDHPRVPRIVGAGMEGGVPYVVRPHRLGRTLRETLRLGPLSPGFAGAVLYTIVETLRELEDLAPSPGAWSLGGFDARDVVLRFDGEIELVGVGLSRVRSPHASPMERDLSAVLALARELDGADEVGIFSRLSKALSLPEMARILRRMACDVLPRRAEIVGATLRTRFEDAIREERAFFGLTPLQ